LQNGQQCQLQVNAFCASNLLAALDQLLFIFFEDESSRFGPGDNLCSTARRLFGAYKKIIQHGLKVLFAYRCPLCQGGAA
jgi:hypothetical protein